MTERSKGNEHLARATAEANEMFGTLQPGDIEEAMNAAAAVGDDRLMEKAGRAPMRDSFTHGSSAERQEWFGRGFNSGELAQCNTFKAAGL